MEQALYAEDPRFATHITNHGRHPAKPRIIVGVLGVVVGLALVLLAAFNALIWLGAIGFALMVAGGAWAFTPAQKAVLGAGGPHGGGGRRAPKGGGFREASKGPGARLPRDDGCPAAPEGRRPHGSRSSGRAFY